MKTTVVTATLLVFCAGIARAAETKEIFEKNCAACHGKDGRGQTMMGRKLSVKDFTDPKVQASFDDAQATKTIKEGKKNKDGNTLMKPFDTLSDDEIKALVAYVRGFNK